MNFLKSCPKRGSRAILVGLAAALAMAGCAAPGDGGGSADSPQGTSEPKQLTVTDVVGREVTVEAPLSNVAVEWSGSGGAFLTMLALEGEDVADKLAGWDPGLKENRDWEWQKISEAVPAMKDVPSIGSVGDDSFDIEGLVALKPDAFIITELLYESDRETIDRVEELGIPVLVIDYHDQLFETHVQSIELLGEVFGQKERAAELTEFYQQHVDDVLERVEEIPESDWPRVYIEVGQEGPEAFGNSSDEQLWGAIIKQVGGDNIAAGAIKDAAGAPLEAEFVLKKDPEVVVITGSHWPGFEHSMRLGYQATKDDSTKRLLAYLDRPGWSHLSAAKDDQLFAIHHILSREIWDAASYEFLAKAFHPEEFEDLDPEGTLKEFHERFLPYDYSGVFMLGPVGR